MARSFLTLTDLPVSEIKQLLSDASEIKKNPAVFGQPLAGKCLGLLFEKPSTRTRISFEVGVLQLGGQAIFLDSQRLQTSRGEEFTDTAAVLGQYLDGIICRTFAQENLEILAEQSKKPVINALSDKFHPCQILADCLTMQELKPQGEHKLTFLGDASSNIAASLVIASHMLGFPLTFGCPAEYQPDQALLAKFGDRVSIKSTAKDAVYQADFVYTDVFVSMGFEEEESLRKKQLAPFEIDTALMQHANPAAKVLHCLPAHKGEEISKEVFDKHKDVIMQQAGNRLHAQKALLNLLFA